MDTEFLSRLLFAITAAFHFLFPPVSIGFSVYILAVEFMWVRTRDEKYLRAAKFFLKLFGLIFAVGVATGIIMVFQFGTNWPVYSNFVGDVFGSPLAIEAIAAFFLESTFLAVALWGWDRVGPRAHLFSTAMVSLGSHLSAVWILAANSFMQTPAGFVLAKGSEIMPAGFVPTPAEVAETSAKISDFWAMVFSPSFADRFAHTVAASWLCGAFLALGVCAYYILRGRNPDIFRPASRIGVYFAALSCLFMLYTGHSSGRGVIRDQPEKIAAFEAHFKTESHAPLYLFGWVDEDSRTVWGPSVSSFFSILAYGRADAEITGLEELPPDDFLLKLHPGSSAEELAEIRPRYWPPVNFVFQTFHFMTYLGGAMFALAGASLLMLWRGSFFDMSKPASRWMQRALLFSVFLPLAASMLGWATAEVGRQPWIVWRILQTRDAVTTAASAGEVLFSIALFTALFTALSAVFCIVFLGKLRRGPDSLGRSETY